MTDPLFQPTLQEKVSPEADLPQWAASSYRANAEAPWNLSSQFWGAFLGGNRSERWRDVAAWMRTKEAGKS